MASKESKVTAGQLIFPVSLIAFVVFIMLAFQTSQLLRERDALHAAKTQQDKPLVDSQKVQAQLDALALGTKKLADQGNKDAQAIIDRMKQAGITVNGAQGAKTAAPTAAAPAADTPSAEPAKAAPAPAAPDAAN
jgi:hypothetical protein